MGLKDIVHKVKEEVDALRGEEVKDKLYEQENTFPDEAAAGAAFADSCRKLFDVNGWSALPGINSTFELHTADGTPSSQTKPRVGNLVKVILPGIKLENWVTVTNIREEADLAEFTVRPCPSPGASDSEETKHFFTSEATSTFRVQKQGTLLRASEIGENERVNQDEASGPRAVLNTMVAEGGWAGFQKLQWNKLTAYLVHLVEPTPS